METRLILQTHFEKKKIIIVTQHFFLNFPIIGTYYCSKCIKNIEGKLYVIKRTIFILDHMY